MTEEKVELSEKLNDLRGLSKKKKYQLARPEHEEVLKTLSGICQMGVESIKTALEALPEFPSDTGAEGVIENWDTLSKHLDVFYKALEGTRYKTELGKRLRLLIGQHLSGKNPEVAMRVLLDVCQDMKPAKKAFPTSKDLALINSTLLRDGISAVARLPLDSGLESHSVQFISYCLGSGFSVGPKGKPLSTPQTQLALIRWANGHAEHLNPGKEIQELIANRIREWDEDFVNLLRAEVDALHPSLREPISGVLEKESHPQQETGIEVVAAPMTDERVVEKGKWSPKGHPSHEGEMGRGHKDTYDALYELGRLMNYIKQANTTLKRREDEIVRLERELNRTEVELGNTRREREDAKRQCSVLEGECAESVAHSKKMEHVMEKLKGQIEDLKEKLAAAENRHKETVQSLNAHADELSERIAKERDHRLTTFRNKLASMLRHFALDLKQARDMEMTPELGTAVRTQLRQVLKILKDQGVMLNGDDE